MADEPKSPNPDAEDGLPPEAGAEQPAADSGSSNLLTPEELMAAAEEAGVELPKSEPAAESETPEESSNLLSPEDLMKAAAEAGVELPQTPAVPESSGTATPDAVQDAGAGGVDPNTINQSEMDDLAAQFREAMGEPLDQDEPAAAAPTPTADGASVEDIMAEAAALAEEANTAAGGNGNGNGHTEAPPQVIGETTVTVSADDAQSFDAPELNGNGNGQDSSGIDLLDDVQLDVRIELGRSDMYIEDVLQLAKGSVVELDKLAGDPVDIYVNSRLIARGEVLVLNDNFCVRINDIHSPIPELEAES